MLHRVTRLQASSVLTLLSVALAASIGILSAPATAQSAPRPVSEITPDDLISATLRASDLAQIVPDAQNWWPKFPEFIRSAAPPPGERFFVAQNYAQPSGVQKLEVRSGLILFDDAAAAKAGLAGIRTTDDADGAIVDGPSVGDESYFFTRITDEAEFETTVRFRTGPVIGRISGFSQTEFRPPTEISAFAPPVLNHVAAVMDGTLKASPLSPEQTAWLPPLSASANVGPILGSAAVPAEAWALIDTEDNAGSTLERLHRLGATQLLYREYELAGHPGHSVDVTVFPFNDEAAAIAWAKEFDDSIQADQRLTAGQIGQHGAFVTSGELYEIQFASSRFAVDLSCFAVGVDLSTDCEPMLRDFAEKWYAAMSGM